MCGSQASSLTRLAGFWPASPFPTGWKPAGRDKQDACLPFMSAIAKENTEPVEHGTSLWKDAWHRLAKNRLAVGGAFLLLVLALASFVGPLFLTQSYATQDLQLGATPPGAQHWLGTDTLGRDLLVRVLYGGQVSIAVGLCATAVALTIGVLYGTTAGFLG